MGFLGLKLPKKRYISLVYISPSRWTILFVIIPQSVCLGSPAAVPLYGHQSSLEQHHRTTTSSLQRRNVTDDNFGNSNSITAANPFLTTDEQKKIGPPSATAVSQPQVELPTYQSIFANNNQTRAEQQQAFSSASRTPSQMSMQEYNNTKNGMRRTTPQ